MGEKTLFFAPNLVRAVSPYNRVEFSFQILNIGQWGCVVVPFSCFIHVTHFSFFFGEKKTLFLPKSCPRCFSIYNRLEFSFQILNIGQWGCVVVPFSRFIHVTHILGIFG